MKSISTQTNNTVSPYNPHSLKAAIFKTLALKLGNELNHGTISPSTVKHFSKLSIMSFFSLPERYSSNSIIACMFLALQTQSVRQNPTTSLFSLIRLLIRITLFFTCCLRGCQRLQRRHGGLWFFSKTGSLRSQQTPDPTKPFYAFAKLSTWFAVMPHLQLLLVQSSVITNLQLLCCSLHPSSTSLCSRLHLFSPPPSNCFAILQILHHEFLQCSITRTISNFISI